MPIQDAGPVTEMYEDAAIALMVSTGRHSGLFEAMQSSKASTSRALAARAALSEGYVTSWLRAMVRGHFVDFDPDAETYTLPREHAAWLTAPRTPDNVGAAWLLAPMLCCYEERLIVDMGKAGDDGAAASGLMQRMKEVRRALRTTSLIDMLLSLESALTRRLQAGLDIGDVGAGSGHGRAVMARAFPHCRFSSVQLVGDGLALKADRVSCLVDAEPGAGPSSARDTRRYDLVTAFEVADRGQHPAQLARASYNALHKGGAFLMVAPLAPVAGAVARKRRGPAPKARHRGAASVSSTKSVATDLWSRPQIEALLTAVGF